MISCVGMVPLSYQRSLLRPNTLLKSASILSLGHFPKLSPEVLLFFFHVVACIPCTKRELVPQLPQLLNSLDPFLLFNVNLFVSPNS